MSAIRTVKHVFRRCIQLRRDDLRELQDLINQHHHNQHPGAILPLPRGGFRTSVSGGSHENVKRGLFRYSGFFNWMWADPRPLPVSMTCTTITAAPVNRQLRSAATYGDFPSPLTTVTAWMSETRTTAGAGPVPHQRVRQQRYQLVIVRNGAFVLEMTTHSVVVKGIKQQKTLSLNTSAFFVLYRAAFQKATARSKRNEPSPHDAPAPWKRPAAGY